MRKAIPLLVVIGLALATAGIAMACRNGDATSYASLENIENMPPFLGRWFRGRPHAPFCRGFGPLISVSEEFKENVMNIAKSDPDVQNLLDAGYENVCVKPIIKAIVQGNGDVTFKATSALVTLRKNGSWAAVHVDLEAGKITKIVKVEWTVIKKS
jgi:hypothetical protein